MKFNATIYTAFPFINCGSLEVYISLWYLRSSWLWLTSIRNWFLTFRGDIAPIETIWATDTYFPLLRTSLCSCLSLCPRHSIRFPIHLLGTGTISSPASGPVPVICYPFGLFSLTLCRYRTLVHWSTLSWMFMVKFLKISEVLALSSSFLSYILPCEL